MRSKSNNVTSNLHEKLINSVLLDKKVLCIGDKYTLTVDLINKDLMVRYWCTQNDNWKLLKDYSTQNKLNLSANIKGDRQVLVECKRYDSKNDYDDYFNIKYEVLEINQIIITEFTLVSEDLIANCKLVFKVEASFEKTKTVLYRFIKINAQGVTNCIQEYSTKNIVSFKENNHGKYKLLCEVKDIYSLRKYDDRAILNYEILLYKKIKINGFISNLISPQPCGTELVFKAYISGGKDPLYRFVVTGSENEDSGFKQNNNFVWKSIKSGKYTIKLYVKDLSYKNEFEATLDMDFIIEDIHIKPAVLQKLILSKSNKILLGDSIEAKAVVSGGVDIRYSFILRKDAVVKQKKGYDVCCMAKFIPEEEGTYELEVIIKDKFFINEYNNHMTTYIQCFGYTPANIEYVLCPLKKYYVISDLVSIDVVIQNTDEILIKYILSINGYKAHETQYSSEKKYTFKPQISGIYRVEIFARNILSYKDFDCRKNIKFIIHEATPVTNTQILVDKSKIKYGETVTFTVKNHGGKNVIYEFYQMKDENWRLAQKYSKKNFYSMIFSGTGKYKILVLVKSHHNDDSYEDYDIMELEI